MALVRGNWLKFGVLFATATLLACSSGGSNGNGGAGTGATSASAGVGNGTAGSSSMTAGGGGGTRNTGPAGGGAPDSVAPAATELTLARSDTSSVTALYVQCHRCGFYDAPEFEALSKP